MSSNSIALRLSGMFTLVALLVFLLIGWALYLQVDKSLGLLPEAEVDARYSVLESAVQRYGNPEHWAKINAKLRLLSVLARRQGEILSKTAIAEMVWDINFDSDANVVEVAIKRLRAKLDGPFEEKLLHTIRGMGYVLESRGVQ